MITSKIYAVLEQLEAANPIALCHVHELVQADQVAEIKYKGTNSRGHHVWHVPQLARDSFKKTLDERFDIALSEHFKPQQTVTPLHVIG
jgi:hypothetical protein